jgi:hypothetical protein
MDYVASEQCSFLTTTALSSLKIYTLTPVNVNPAHNPVARVNLGGEVYQIKDEEVCLCVCLSVSVCLVCM